jgi:CHAT domain-containing protein/tetratricopeptide (TPR) repeat protein
VPKQAHSPVQVAEELKAEAERQLSVDSERSLAIADQIFDLGDDPDIRGLGWLARADALRELGRYTEAAHTYEDAARLFREAADEVGWARTRIGAILNARYTGEYIDVVADVEDARRILTKHGLWLRLTRLENHTGALQSWLGRTAEALEAYQRALEAAEHMQPRSDMLEAEVFASLSLAYYQGDDLVRAEEYRGRAAAIFEREGLTEFVSRLSRNYARFAAGRGHYSQALAAVLPGRRALLGMGRTDAAAHLGYVGVESLIRLNRSAEAAELAETVAAEFESTGARVDAAATHEWHALALANLGEAEAALGALERADTLFGGANWEAGLTSAQLRRAVLLSQAGRWRAALEQAELVRDDLLRHGRVVRAVEADLIRARALRALGQPRAAADAARAALALVRDRALPWLSYHAWRVLGELALDVGDQASALDAFLKAIGDLEQVQGRILTEYRASYLQDKTDVFEAAVDLLLRQGEGERAFDLVERAKSRALVDALAGGLDIRIRPRTPEQARLADELARLRRDHDELAELDDRGPELREQERRISQILEELRLAGAQDLERLSLLEGRVYSPQANLDDRTALVELYRIGADYAVFVMDRTSLRVKRLERGAAKLRRLYGPLQLNLNAAISEAGRRATLEPNVRALLQRAYDVLLRPIEDWLDKYERLIVVSNGRLWLLPFSALHDGQRYLLEKFEVATAPSASSLSFCLRPRSRTSQRMLVGAHSADGALPGVLEEARAIAAMYGGVCLLDEDLTLAALKEAASQADLIHLAAHGVARLDAPQFSYLRLADGHQTALDCFDLELDCTLVTLSACESGRGRVTAGDEQIGLPRAFLYAGARAVVHTLWRIDDQSTRIMMERFYTELRSGRGRGAALRTAQLAYLHDGAVHPFLWASLTLVGDWR